MRKNHPLKSNRDYQFNSCFLLGLLFILMMLGTSFFSPVLQADETTLLWSCQIDITETNGETDYVIIQEDSNSWDGPSNDPNDAPNPPSGPGKLLDAYFDDGLTHPYDQLQIDSRFGPDQNYYKVFNLTVSYSGETMIQLTWNPADFSDSEYRFVNLTDESFNLLSDMKTHGQYSFDINYVPKTFHIVCAADASRDTGDNDDQSGNPSPPDDPDGSNDNIVPPPPTTNDPPVANASKSETQGFINQSLQFDASASTDDKNNIINYTWDFDDETQGFGKQINHVFKNSGNYSVNLMITDDNDQTDTDTITVRITTGNNPPMKPEITGPSEKLVNEPITFSIRSTDADNDFLQFIINWGDNTTNQTDFLPMDSHNFTHTYQQQGLYTIQVQTFDNKTYSQTTEKTISIQTQTTSDKKVDDSQLGENKENSESTQNMLPLQLLGIGLILFLFIGIIFWVFRKK
mgnify:CR=1 FL=1